MEELTKAGFQEVEERGSSSQNSARNDGHGVFSSCRCRIWEEIDVDS